MLPWEDYLQFLLKSESHAVFSFRASIGLAVSPRGVVCRPGPLSFPMTGQRESVHCTDTKSNNGVAPLDVGFDLL